MTPSSFWKLTELFADGNVALLAISLHEVLFTGKPLDYHDRNVGETLDGEISMQSSKMTHSITMPSLAFLRGGVWGFEHILAASLDKPEKWLRMLTWTLTSVNSAFPSFGASLRRRIMTGSAKRLLEIPLSPTQGAP